MQTKIIIANWKENIFSEREAKALINSVRKAVEKISGFSVVFSVPFVYFYLSKKNKDKKFLFGAQDVSREEKGSFTGEISVHHLKDFNISHCIVGHSERREMGENDSSINKKIKLCLLNGIKPIICIGEIKRDDGGQYLEFIKNQLRAVLSGVSKAEALDCIIAYEPVYAIGNKEPLPIEEIHESVLWIKKCLKETYGSFVENIKIIYGGSVNEENSRTVIQSKFIDGILVGKRSLDSKGFAEIIKTAGNIKKK